MLDLCRQRNRALPRSIFLTYVLSISRLLQSPFHIYNIPTSPPYSPTTPPGPEQPASPRKPDRLRSAPALAPQLETIGSAQGGTVLRDAKLGQSQPPR